MNTPDEIKDEVQQLYAENLSSLYKKHHANEVLKQMDAHIEEAREYFEILKKGIYEE